MSSMYHLQMLVQHYSYGAAQASADGAVLTHSVLVELIAHMTHKANQSAPGLTLQPVIGL
jgi:hypothetical protein